MPPFSHLRPDYPLYLTLFDHVHECALTRFYIACLTSCRPIRISPVRHHGPTPVSSYPRSCANSRSFAFAPFASKSTCGLTPARASLREFRLYIDEQLTTPSNTDMRRRAATLNSIYLAVAGFVVLQIAAMCRLLGSVFKSGTEPKSALPLRRLCRAVVDIGASQVR